MPTFAGAVRKLQTNGLRNTVMLRLRRINRMCSRTVSDTANRLLKRTDSEGSSSVAEKKSSAVPLISKRSHIGNLRQIRKQGKGRSSKRKGNRRCPFLFAPAAGAATFPPPWVRHYRRKTKTPQTPVRGVLFYSISSRTEKAASCSVLSSLYSISREYALQMQICAQCVTSPLASHSYTSSS